MRFTFLILVTLSLVACGSKSDDIGGGGYGPQHHKCVGEGHKAGSATYLECMNSGKKILSPDAQSCKHYGFREGTDKFSECLMQISERRRQKQIAEQQRRQVLSEELIRRGGAMMSCSKYGTGLGAMATGNCTPPPQPKTYKVFNHQTGQTEQYTVTE